MLSERHEALSLGEDDTDPALMKALATLTPEQRETLDWELEICDALDKKYGWRNVTDEMREEAIANDGAGL